MEDITFTKLDKEQKKILLEALGFSVEEDGLVLNDEGKPHICPYTQKKVFLENASILPGSIVVINTSSLTLSEYITDYVDVS